MQKDAVYLADQPHTTHWQESTTAKVSCDSQDIPAGKEPGSVLQERGLLQGVKSVFNSWLTKGLILQEQPTSALDAHGSEFVQSETRAHADHDQETDMYTQTLDVQVTFQPSTSLRGEIIDLENEQSMAAGFDQILIQGQEWISQTEGAFFIVARPILEAKGSTLRMIGSGRIYHVLGHLAQGRLLETNKEIHVGDFIYPVWVSSRMVEEQQPDILPEADENVPEVEVHPQPKPTNEWSKPAEPK